MFAFIKSTFIKKNQTDSSALGGRGSEQSLRAAKIPFLRVLVDFGFVELKGRETDLRMIPSLLSYTFLKEFPLG